MSNSSEGSSSGDPTETSGNRSTQGAVQMLNKRPRLLSFQGLSSHSRSLADRDGAAPMAGTSSSSMEHINRREQLANDLRSWQECQIAACVEDNILNMVLERYLVFFEQRNNSNENQQVQEEHDDEMLEDEAIRMAINERGLQATGAVGMAGPSSSSPPPMAVAREERNPVLAGSSAPDWPELGRALHDNFILETAVAAAIQEKGLITTEETDSDDSVIQEDDAR